MASSAQPINNFQVTAELPSQWHGGGAVSGPVNTQFRHELQDQSPCQSGYSTPHTWKRFAIATDNESLSSGFPYQHRLHELGIMQDQWYQFTHEIITAAKLTSSEDAAAWSAGIAAGTGSTPFLLIFGPVVGYYTGKSIHKKTVIKKVQERLAEEEGQLRTILLRWNEGVFKDRGVQLWLEPPFEAREQLVDISPGMTKKDIERAAKKQAKKFTIVVMPYIPQHPLTRQLTDSSTSISPQPSPQVTWSTKSAPAPYARLMQTRYEGSREPNLSEIPKEIIRKSLSLPASELPASTLDGPLGYSSFELDATPNVHTA